MKQIERDLRNAAETAYEANRTLAQALVAYQKEFPDTVNLKDPATLLGDLSYTIMMYGDRLIAFAKKHKRK